MARTKTKWAFGVTGTLALLVALGVLGFTTFLGGTVWAEDDDADDADVTIRFGLPEFNPAPPVNPSRLPIPPSSLNSRFDRHSLTPIVETDETVLFDLTGFHQVAIYGPGGPGALHGAISILGPGNLVNDPTNRVVGGLGPLDADFSYTFTVPGTYLVICNIATHFDNDGMFMYLTVGDDDNDEDDE